MECGSNATVLLAYGQAERGSTYSVLQCPRDPVVDQVSILKEMSFVDGGHELGRDSELEITPRFFVTSQELEASGKWAIGRQEVVDTVELGMVLHG